MHRQICIPCKDVPDDILDILKEIHQRRQSESIVPPRSSPSLSKDHEDETDSGSCSASTKDSQTVVHVLPSSSATSYPPSVTSGEYVQARTDDDVVSVFASRSSPAKNSHSEKKGPSFQLKAHSQPDVVSLFANVPSSSSSSVPSASNTNACESPRHVQTIEQCQTYKSPQQPFTHSSNFYRKASGHNHSDTSEFPLSTSPDHQGPSSTLTSTMCQEVGDEPRQYNSWSPSKCPADTHEDRTQQQQSSPSKYFKKLSMSDRPADVTASSSPSEIQQSRSFPSYQPFLVPSDSGRIFSPRLGSSSAEVGILRSPKLLTPPETPDGDRGRGYPEIFKFDDLTCTQERLRQMVETLQHLEQQQAQNISQRHPSSLPSTPSYRRPEIPRSPSRPRQVSPVDQRLLQHLETAAASPPQPKMKTTEIPRSPACSAQPTLRREYPPQRRGSVSPTPKKRLSFEASSASSYPTLSPRLPGFESSMFAFPPNPAEELQPGRAAAPGLRNSSLDVVEPQGRMPPSHLYPEGRADEDKDRRVNTHFSAASSLHDSLDFDRPFAPDDCYLSGKKRRFEPGDGGNDDIHMCACAVMERHFLLMAERAYKHIRLFDTSSTDFERFRNQLAQTNDILRESLVLLKKTKEVCDHWKRLSW